MHLEKLRNATRCLLSSEDQAAIHIALNTIHTIFSEITTVRGDISEPHHDEETFLDGGVAISPHLAARCLFDPIRTVQFLRGINAAISDSIHRFPSERINILYAGCGPYGTLLLPLTTRFTPEEIQLTLIDIHKPSIDGVRSLIKALGIENYIYKCVQADAVTYRHPTEVSLHMVISETMEAGLAREPQLAIMRNFLPQLQENGLFIPENIVVEACLSSSEQEDIGLLMHRDELGYPVGREMQQQMDRLPLEQIIAVNSELAHPQEIGYGWESIPLTTIEIPPRDERFDQFLLFTTVSIFGSYGFKPYDCELSFPLRLHDLNQVASGSRIQFSYVFGQRPGLQYELIPGKGL
jgi:hypothetical protein